MNLFRKLAFGVAALAIAGLAIAVSPSVYAGFNTITGTLVDISTDVPLSVLSGPTSSAQKGGANAGVSKATGTTTGAFVFTWVAAAPNGRRCGIKDLTTPADTVVQNAYTTTTVTFQGTIVSADVMTYDCTAF